MKSDYNVVQPLSLRCSDFKKCFPYRCNQYVYGRERTETAKFYKNTVLKTHFSHTTIKLFPN